MTQGDATFKGASRLRGVHADLVKVVRLAHGRALEAGDDFMVVEGLRTLARQKELFEKGASRTMNSRHLTGLASSSATLDANAPNDISRGLPSSTEYHNPSDRFACTAHWSRALSNAELTSLYNDLKLNFPGMG